MEKIIQKIPKRFKSRKTMFGENFWGILMASVPLIGAFFFMLIPLVFSLILSFCSMKGFDPASIEFLGAKHLFDNYVYIFKDGLFWKSVGNTFYAVLSLPLSMAIALALSVVMNSELKGKTIFRTIFFLPYVCSVVALTNMWRLMLDTNYGILNEFLGIFGVDKINWLSNEKTYMPAMIIMGAWTSLGFNIILFSAALTGVSKSYYEAARIDGAGKFAQFRSITLPLISPTTFYLLVMGLIGGVQDFTRFQAISFGETRPNNAGLTMVFYLYQQGFTNNYTYGMGFAAATSWVVALLILGLTVVNFKVSKKWVHYD